MMMCKGMVMGCVMIVVLGTIGGGQVEAQTPDQSGEQGAAVGGQPMEPLQPAGDLPVPEIDLADVSIVSQRVQKRPEGVTLSTVTSQEIELRPGRHMKESFDSMPGVILRQANGPRDFSLSVRGSGVKTSFAIRDFMVYEDGFMQTQSDGLSRLDMHDPWFMRSVDVTRGASSSLYGNYALGGMVQFRTRRGSDINGVETLLAGGSYGYNKQGIAFGQHTDKLDLSFFGSNVREDGYVRHSNYETQTVNFNARYSIDDRQTLYFKAISNWLDAKVPTRLTEAQFNANDRQAGGSQTSCTRNTYNANCADANMLGQKRTDRRTNVGAIYEREIDASTVLTVHGAYDEKDINQYFSQVTDNINQNFYHYTDLRHNGRIGDMPLKSYAGVFFNRMKQDGETFQNMADGIGTKGLKIQDNQGWIQNMGIRFREELEFVPKWTLAAGLGYERSHLNVHAVVLNSGASNSNQAVTRDFDNWAPEMSLTWKPAEGYRHWIRASTGYAIPQISQLTRNPTTGLPGENFQLKPQKNYNMEIGTASQLSKTLSIELVGFWVFVHNEFISQSIGTASNTATVNADLSQYRGVELAYDWRPIEAWRFAGAYTHTIANYVNFQDVSASVPTSRDGKKVPNVPVDYLNAKVEYDQVAYGHKPAGWGAWIQGSWMNSYLLNNANTIGIPAYLIGNANIHYEQPLANNAWFRFAKMYVEVNNIADTKYAASGQVTSANSMVSNSTQLYFAGYGRSAYAGVTLGF
ncbi:MAG: TonB-dependent receptor [Nitrospirae bacterium]|nr:TonB-dependent receptor [Nitrospirota bacterium]